ncbi:uncharacterized protein LOC114303764 [Camellia sinensis]|uniref:uncharacterized protein LOC114303764 n=1 Tax=Camellia sinensis TaxID=4442 RepID=UPI0010363CC7|nr:uncharacterized protein LOC114303764 [Camellia sinensis]
MEATKALICISEVHHAEVVEAKEYVSRRIQEDYGAITFSETYDKMPGLDLSLVTHHLDTFPNSKSIKQHARKYHPDLEAKIKAEKKNGQIRVCVDFRDLNKACLKDEFPLPHVNTLVDSIAGHQMFSFMDGFSGYN